MIAKHKLAWIGGLSVALFSLNAQAESIRAVDKKLRQIIQKSAPKINIGIEVKDITSNRVIFKKNADRHFVPASNLKIFSDAAALLYLGPDFRFDTKLLSNSHEIQNGVLKGDVFVAFDGAPDLTTAQLDKMVRQLKERGINKITGRVMAVPANYPEKPYGPGWMIDDADFSYGAPVSPYILDKNTITVSVSPHSEIKHLAFAKTTRAYPSVRINNQVKTMKEARLCRIHFNMTKANKLNIRGCIGAMQVAKEEEVAIKNPKRYVLKTLEQLMAQHQIQVQGGFHQGKLKGHEKVLAHQYSKPLAEIIKMTLKPSDNLFADSVFLKVGEKYSGKKATWRNASMANKKILIKNAGIKLRGTVMVDGSGLSRYNLITPHQMVGLLSFIDRAFPIKHEFIAALPVAGRDGTLKQRLMKDARDRVRAKTGAMLGVVSLSGYLPTKNNHLLAFSMMMNGISGGSQNALFRYRMLEDKICQYLLSVKLKERFFGFMQKRYPFERRISTALKSKKDNNRMVNLEWALRKKIKASGVNIIKYADHIAIEGLDNIKQHPAIFNQVANIIKKRDGYVWLDSHNTNLQQSLKKSLSAKRYVLNKKQKRVHSVLKLYL